MNLKRLPKEKRQHLLLVGLLTAVALGGLGFGLVRFQYAHLAAVQRQESDAIARLQKMKDAITRGAQAESELAEASQQLDTLEDGMAAGDPYSWALDLVRGFRQAYRVDVPGISQPVVGDCTLLPKFPYRQASLSLSGSGYYHDIGRFVADFENQFPQIRVVNLSLVPLTGGVNEDREKLEFKLDIVALVRPNPS